MSDVKIAQDPTLDVAAIFAQAKNNKDSNNSQDSTPTLGKSPLQMMREQQNRGLVIQNNNDDGPKHGGPITEERLEAVTKTLDEMDELAEKAKLVAITKKPTSDLEMAALVDGLDKLDINEVRRASQEGVVNKAIDSSVVKEENVIGSEITADTSVTNNTVQSIDKTGMFVPISQVDNTESFRNKTKVSSEVKPETIEDSDKVNVTINKDGKKEGDKFVVEFTPEEREKLIASKQIELVSVNTININTGKVTRPDETFTKNYSTNLRELAGSTSKMTFVASRFRATLKGLTFGQYMNLALSVDITDVEVLNKKLSVIYNSIVDTSIGSFTSYDDFLRNFAYKDIPLATYALYITTNPEVLELGLVCGVDSCKKNFSVAFSPRNLLLTNALSERFLEIMEKTGRADGKVALDYHNESTIITKHVVELPISKIGIEFGLRSCYDMIHTVLPFINEAEEYMKDKYPDDINHIHEIVSLATNYVSAIYFKDENGDYTIREDNIERIVDVLYDIPMADYDIISSIMGVTDADYAYGFGVQNVKCPACGNVTNVVQVDIDNEVFRQFQEQGSTKINKDTLPRL